MSVSSTTVMKKPTFSLSWQSPTRTESRQLIPLEIFEEIFSYLMPSQDDAFSDEEHKACFLSLNQTCKYFAAVARPVIWGSKTLVVQACPSSDFACSVAKKDPLALHLAQFIKKCRMRELSYVGNVEVEEEDDISNNFACALGRMEVEELTISHALITKKFLKLLAVLAPKLKALTVEETCCLTSEVTDADLRPVFGAMRELERLRIIGYTTTQRILMEAPSMIPLSNLQRLYTDTLFSIDACIANGAPLTHLEMDGMDATLLHDTRFLYAKLQSLPSLTHIWIHDVIDCFRPGRPMILPVDDMHNLISVKGPPGLVPKFFSLGPKLQCVDCTCTNQRRPYIASSHVPGTSSEDFAATNIRELVLFDCDITSGRGFPPVNKHTPHLRVMRVRCLDMKRQSDRTVPQIFQELARTCEARRTPFPVEELVMTFSPSYFKCPSGWSARPWSWVVDLKQQLAMIEGLSDGLPELKRVLFHGGYLAWARDVDDGGKWKPRMLNANRFRDFNWLLFCVLDVDYMGCLAPFLRSALERRDGIPAAGYGYR